MRVRINQIFGLLVVLSVVSCDLASGAGEAVWIEDFESAKSQARRDGKDLLLDFTGSDWCGYCIRLQKEVFSRKPFWSEAPKHFVLVELDFPRTRELDPLIRDQNRRLAEAFGVEGFPTIFLADAEGRPYARTGYKHGGVASYMKHLEELRGVRVKRDEFFQKAEADGKKGVDRARLLDQGLQMVLDQGVPISSYGSTMEKIVELDEDNQAGFRAKYVLILGLGQIDQFMEQGEFVEAEAKIEDLITTLKPEGEMLQHVSFTKAIAQLRQGKSEVAIASLEQALKAAPDSPLAQRIEGAIYELGGG